MNDRKGKNILLVTLTVFVFLTFLFFFRASVLKLSSKLALLSAKSYIPVVKCENEPTATESDTTVQPTTERKETTEKQQPETTKIAKTEPFTKTPDDIAEIIDLEKEASKDHKKDGAISEYQYINDGVTDKYQNIRVKNVNKTGIDIKKLLSEEIDLSVKKDEPSVLIFHTHTTETYQILDRGYYQQGFLTRTNDIGRNMVRVGQAIVQQIEQAGFTVIHDTSIYDSTYTGAYGKSRAGVEKYLKENPSIKIVLDIHRDAIQRSDGTKIKATAEIEGKKAAQIMIISGCQEEGNPVENFPNWEKNLVFAVHLQKQLEDLFPGITRPLYFSPRKYNMDLTECSLLVEVGTDANTLEEAVYTGKCLGKAISEMLKKHEK